MRHRVAGYKLGRTSDQRKGLRRTMIRQLFEHERIQTTRAKAASIRGEAERLITVARNSADGSDMDKVNARRLVAARLLQSHLEMRRPADVVELEQVIGLHTCHHEGLEEFQEHMRTVVYVPEQHGLAHGNAPRVADAGDRGKRSFRYLPRMIDMEDNPYRGSGLDSLHVFHGQGVGADHRNTRAEPDNQAFLH